MMLVNLYATFRLLAGVKTLEIDLPAGATPRQVVQEVLRQCPKLSPHWVDEQGELYPHVHVFIDGEDMQNLPGQSETPLPAGASIDFFPPVVGG